MKAIKIVALIFCSLIAITILAGLLLIWSKYNQLGVRPFNRKFIYSQNKSTFIYDLATDTTTPVETDANNAWAFDWSNDGKVAIIDNSNNVYLLEKNSTQAKKVAEKMQGPIFWDPDSSKFYFEDNTPVVLRSILDVEFDESNKYHQQGYVYSTTDHKITPLDKDLYRSTLRNPTLEIDRLPASFDGQYYSDASVSIAGVAYLIDVLKNQQYTLDDQIWRPFISTQKTYIGWAKEDQKTHSTSLYIYKLSDALNGLFNHPVRIIKDIEWDFWEWIDDNQLVYLTSSHRDDGASGFDQIDYFTIDVTKGEAHKLTTTYAVAQDYQHLYVNPDRKTFARMQFEGPYEMNDYTGVFSREIVIHDLLTGKIIKQFAYENGEWSKPILMPKQSFLEFAKAYISTFFEKK